MHRTESVVAANWKILVENYNECLHCPIVHPELVEAIPAYKKGMVFDPDRPDGGVAIVTGGNTYSNDPRARRTLLPNMTEEQAASIYGAQVFPTMFLDIAGSNAVVTRLSWLPSALWAWPSPPTTSSAAPSGSRPAAACPS